MKKIKKGDNVMIILGKDRGRSGTVERIFFDKGKILVSGINIVKRHIGKKATGQTGQILDLVKPVNISNVLLICTNCNKPTRVGFKMEGTDKIRVCKKCKKEVK